MERVRLNRRRNSYKYYYRYMCAAVLLVVATAIFSFFWIGFVRDNNTTGSLMGKGNLGMALGVYVFLYALIGRGLHAFKIGVERTANVIAAQVLTVLVLGVAEIFISLAITGQFRFFFRFVRLYIPMILVQGILLGILVIPMIQKYRKTFPPLLVLEIFGDYDNQLIYKMNGLKYKYLIDKSVNYKDADKAIVNGVGKYDAVLINDIPAWDENHILKLCFDMGLRAYLVPKISDIIIRSSEELNLIDTPLFLCRNIGLTKTQALVKRAFDIVTSSVAILLLSPVFLITAIAIKLDDGGPVFYMQERCSLNGKKFQILKFRSMIVDAEKDGKSRPAGEDDDRITKVGRITRKFRIDELPQLINILKGEMSVVGPRPERVEHVEKYTEEIPEFTLRSKVKGGLTGYAQVYGKYNTTALDKLKMDLDYILNYSFILDLQIIFETIKILFQKESTEGFSEEKIQEIRSAGQDDIANAS